MAARATPTVAKPPNTTEPTGPHIDAVAPDSNSPSWLDAPMKMELTAATRPRMSSGVSSWSSVIRVTTLTLSAAPVTMRAPMESAILVERPKTKLAIPNTATATNIQRPTLRSIGHFVKTTAISNAPTAGDDLRIPRPSGPVCKMSLAKMGSNAVAPPKSTANRSSAMAPNSTL